MSASDEFTSALRDIYDSVVGSDALFDITASGQVKPVRVIRSDDPQAGSLMSGVRSDIGSLFIQAIAADIEGAAKDDVVTLDGCPTIYRIRKIEPIRDPSQVVITLQREKNS